VSTTGCTTMPVLSSSRSQPASKSVFGNTPRQDGVSQALGRCLAAGRGRVCGRRDGDLRSRYGNPCSGHSSLGLNAALLFGATIMAVECSPYKDGLRVPLGRKLRPESMHCLLVHAVGDAAFGNRGQADLCSMFPEQVRQQFFGAGHPAGRRRKPLRRCDSRLVSSHLCHRASVNQPAVGFKYSLLQSPLHAARCALMRFASFAVRSRRAILRS
jgi:hypothetical protein